MPSRDDYDDDDRHIRDSVPFPMIVRLAGIIWIGFGALGLGGTILSFVLQTGDPNAKGGAGGNVCSLGCSALFAIAFLAVGVQTVNGTAKGTMGNGIGSVIFGLLYAAITIFFLAAGPNLPEGMKEGAVIVGAMTGLLSLTLLAAGVLAIAGRDAYATWRKAQGHGGSRSSRSSRRIDDDEVDDRPRGKRRDDDEDNDLPQRLRDG